MHIARRMTLQKFVVYNYHGYIHMPGYCYVLPVPEIVASTFVVDDQTVPGIVALFQLAYVMSAIWYLLLFLVAPLSVLYVNTDDNCKHRPWNCYYHVYYHKPYSPWTFIKWLIQDPMSIIQAVSGTDWDIFLTELLPWYVYLLILIWNIFSLSCVPWYIYFVFIWWPIGHSCMLDSAI